MTRYGSHTESRMRETCTYGSMRGRAYPTTRGAPLYSTPSCPRSTVSFARRNARTEPECGHAGTSTEPCPSCSTSRKRERLRRWCSPTIRRCTGVGDGVEREVSRRGAQAAAGPSKQPGCISLGRRECAKIIPVLLATAFPVLKSTRQIVF